jgi:hypothetical protein
MNPFRAWRELQLWLRTVPARAQGSYVELGAEGFTHLGVGATFPGDPVLEQRRADARERLGPVPSTPRKVPRVLIEEQPDVPVAPPPIPTSLDDLPAARSTRGVP